MALLEPNPPTGAEIEYEAARIGLQKAAEEFASAKLKLELEETEAVPISDNEINSIIEAVRESDTQRLLRELLSRVKAAEQQLGPNE